MRHKIKGVGLSISGGGILGLGISGGHLLALDYFMASHTLNDFEVVSGHSAGAGLAASLAVGLPIGVTLPMILSERCKEFNMPQFKHSFAYKPSLNKDKVVHSLSKIKDLAHGLTKKQWTKTNLVDLFPVPLFSLDSFVNYFNNLAKDLCTEDLRCLPQECYIGLYDLITNQSMIAGSDEVRDIKIGDAIAASQSIPFIWGPRPIDIYGRKILGLDLCATGNNIEFSYFKPSIDIIFCSNSINFQTEINSEEFYGFGTLLNSVFQLLYQKVTNHEISQAINSQPQRQLLNLSGPKRLLPSNFFLFSFEDALKACELSFNSTKDYLLKNENYFQVVFKHKGVTLNPDFKNTSFMDLYNNYMKMKNSIREKYAPSFGEIVIGNKNAASHCYSLTSKKVNKEIIFQPKDLPRPNVLFIDDDIEIINLVKEFISDQYVNGFFASTVTEGFEILTKENIDVCVVDYQMPDGGAVYFLDEYYHIDEFCSPIVMTGHGSEETVVNFINKL